LGCVTVVAAVVTLPKKPGTEVDTSQSRAIKEVRSLELKDADIFCQVAAAAGCTRVLRGGDSFGVSVWGVDGGVGLWQEFVVAGGVVA
jgi:hypothetical protein